jgi:hypothetical protein
VALGGDLLNVYAVAALVAAAVCLVILALVDVI